MVDAACGIALPSAPERLQSMTPQHHRGLTLIELMICLAIAGVLLALAGPGMQQLINVGRIDGAANTLASAMALARAESVRNNRRVVLCRSTDGSACDGSASTWPGWILFVDSNGNGTRDGTETVIKSGTFDGPLVVKSSAAITALGERISFRADGMARAADSTTLLTGMLASCIATTRPALNARDLSLAFGRRTTIRSRNGSASCGTPADS